MKLTLALTLPALLLAAPVKLNVGAGKCPFQMASTSSDGTCPLNFDEMLSKVDSKKIDVEQNAIGSRYQESVDASLVDELVDQAFEEYKLLPVLEQVRLSSNPRLLRVLCSTDVRV
jgi:hypothetical protein